MSLLTSPKPSASSAPSVRRSLLAGRARVPALVLGDAVMLLLFAGTGRASHGETSGLGALAQVALTAAPFAIGWFAVAPFAGAFRRDATATSGAMLRRTELAWLGAWPVTLLLRWAFTGRVPRWDFALVILLTNALLLGVWRGVFAFILSRRAGTPPAR